MTDSRPILVLGMFDVSRLDSARPVRIQSLAAALGSLAPTVLIAGRRAPRRAALLRYLFEGGVRRSRAVYVEASTSTATETDVVFLTMARAAGLPVLVYVPDAYQLFPGLYPRHGWRTALLDWAWRRSITAYSRLADRLLFPSTGLAACVRQWLGGSGAAVPCDVLPPAGPAALGWSAPAREPPVVVYAGATSFNEGSDLLLTAMTRVVARHPAARCRFVTPDARFIDSHPARRADWLVVESTDAGGVHARLRAATLAVIPRRVNPYSDLAAPLKLFDYMASGRPLVATACRNTATLVDALRCGMVVADDPASLADGMARLIEDRVTADHLGENGYRAVQTAHSWRHRAERILELIGSVERRDGRGLATPPGG
jgi:glycosyltransferase involved in cell wall biosynthesis